MVTYWCFVLPPVRPFVRVEREHQVHAQQTKPESSRSSRRPSATSTVSRGQFPVSLRFGRPNIKQFIARIVGGVEESAGWIGAESELGSVVRSVRCALRPAPFASLRLRLRGE